MKIGKTDDSNATIQNNNRTIKATNDTPKKKYKATRNGITKMRGSMDVSYLWKGDASIMHI